MKIQDKEITNNDLRQQHLRKTKQKGPRLRQTQLVVDGRETGTARLPHSEVSLGYRVRPVSYK